MKIRTNRFVVQWHFVVMVWSLFQIPSYSQDVNSHAGTSVRGSEGSRPVNSDSEVIDVSNDYLVPANTKGNPGFTYRISSAKTDSSSASGDPCQGTLISANNNTCVVATAAHCLYPQIVKTGIQSLSGNFCGTANGTPAKSGEVAIETADFGKVKAQAIVHPLAKSDGSDLHDVGILKFSCPEGAKNVPVVKVDSSPMQPDEDIWYGKVKGAKGLWTGRAAKDKVTFKFKSSNGKMRTQTYDNTVYEDKRQSDNTRHVVVQNSDHSAQTGDSGGPALAERDGEKVLIGILSGTPGVSSAAIYQTNSSMDFIKCFAEKKSEASRALAGKAKPAEKKTPGDAVSGGAPGSEQTSKQKVEPVPTSTQSKTVAQPQSRSEKSTETGPSHANLPAGGNCKDGVCQVGPEQAGVGGSPNFFGEPSNPVQPGVQGPPVEQGTPEPIRPTAQPSSPRPTQGFKEVQAADDASFKQALRQARQDGVKNVIVTYGNYDRCPACRNLRDELQQQFGNDGDVRVIKMPEEFRPNAQGFIPQSRLLTPKPNGMWEQSPNRIGSTGTAANYKTEVDRLRNTQPAQQQPQLSQGPAEQPAALQPQPQQNTAQAPKIEGPSSEDPREEFTAGEYKFVKNQDGGLVRIGPNGEKKIPRLQQLPSGKSDLVYDAHSNSPNPFSRASKLERKKLRDYYLGIREDKTAWDKVPGPSKALIESYLKNWDELDNKYRLEALKAEESKPAEEPKVEPVKEEKPEKIKLTHEQFIDALGNQGISEVETLSKDKYKPDFLIGTQHIFWMKDDLTGKSYRFLYDETSGKLSHNPLPEVAAEPTPKADTKSTPKTATKYFKVKDLIPAATIAGEVAAEFAANKIFPGAGTLAKAIIRDSKANRESVRALLGSAGSGKSGASVEEVSPKLDPGSLRGSQAGNDGPSSPSWRNPSTNNWEPGFAPAPKIGGDGLGVTKPRVLRSVTNPNLTPEQVNSALETIQGIAEKPISAKNNGISTWHPGLGRMGNVTSAGQKIGSSTDSFKDLSDERLKQLKSAIQQASGYKGPLKLAAPAHIRGPSFSGPTGDYEHLLILNDEGKEIGIVKFTAPVEIKFIPGVMK